MATTIGEYAKAGMIIGRPLGAPGCEKHGYMAEGVKIGGSIFYPMCPDCEATEQDRVAEQEREEALAAVEERRIARLVESNIEPHYFNATLDTFRVETDEQRKALACVDDMCEGRVQKILMLGKHGTGKTHLGCAAIQQLSGKILTMYEIATMIRASYTAIAKQTELQIVDELARVPLLVIDEIGRTKGSDAEANWLSYIIDKRHVRGLPLILITNKHDRKSCKAAGCPDCVENYIGEDIMSRLSDGGKILRFTGADQRRAKA